MNARIGRLVTLVVLVLGALANPGLSIIQSADDPLETGFAKPPNEARPRVWWHWMNGNITKEGIKLDLEWMHRVGIGGFQNFDASLFADQVVEKRLVYMTPEWKDAFSYATDARRPARPRDGDRRLAGLERVGRAVGQARAGHEESRVERDARRRRKAVHGRSAQATHDHGPFQNAPRIDLISVLSRQAPPPRPEFYKDSAVIAFKRARRRRADERASARCSRRAAGRSMPLCLPTAISSSPPPSRRRRWARRPGSSSISRKPVTIRGVSLAIAGFKWQFGPPPPGPDLEASDDGQTFRKIANIPGSTSVQNTVSFAPVSARFFRVAFVTPPPPPPREIDIPLPPPPAEHPIAELVLHTGARVNRFEEKAAFVPLAGLSRSRRRRP